MGLTRGAVYIFKRTGSNYGSPQEISDQATGFTALKSEDWFGRSLTLNGDYLAVGALKDDGQDGSDTGAVYVFKRNTTTDVWGTPQEISDQATGFTALKAADRFGISLALDGDYLAIGAFKDDGDSGGDTGAVYVFKRTNDTWGTPHEISDKAGSLTDLQPGDEFGRSVALSGAYLVSGAFKDDLSGASDVGTAYAFKRTGTYLGQCPGTGGNWSLRDGR